MLQLAIQVASCKRAFLPLGFVLMVCSLVACGGTSPTSTPRPPTEVAMSESTTTPAPTDTLHAGGTASTSTSPTEASASPATIGTTAPGTSAATETPTIGPEPDEELATPVLKCPDCPPDEPTPTDCPSCPVGPRIILHGVKVGSYFWWCRSITTWVEVHSGILKQVELAYLDNSTFKTVATTTASGKRIKGKGGDLRRWRVRVSLTGNEDLQFDLKVYCNSK
jgi:hypothetical protein